jgi:hypothetical protein
MKKFFIMKKFFLILMLIPLLTTSAIGQITTTKVAQKIDHVETTPYDSTQNFLGKDVFKYQGQELYLKGKSERLRKYGYDGFVLDYRKDKIRNKTNVYKCCDGYNSKYEELTEKYFKVLEIVKHPKAEEYEFLYGKNFYLKLQEKASDDIVYFEYDCQLEHSFPFIVVGFFEKQKKLTVGKEFVIADKFQKNLTDIQTGKSVTVETGQKWKCLDFTIEEIWYTLSLIIENSLGEKAAISYESALGEFSYGGTYLANEADNYIKKLGQENFDLILQGIVKIGFTKEMCRLSWGEPKKINETVTAGKKTEQWVYYDNYLYFDNGILTAKQ